MAKLGSEKNPVIVRVQTQKRLEEVAKICHDHGLRFIVGLEPLKPEDISDLERALNAPDPLVAEAKPGRNDPCPCASGKKYKKCCGAEE
jgi:SWIM/SEC-C metal-binding protein